ncbi:spore coat U domain-containing protein [Affinibrenneria salicis]
MRFPYGRFLAPVLMLICPPGGAGTVTDTFSVSASIEGGCAFGTTTTSGQTDLGTIDFGTLTSLNSPLDVASSAGNGSILVTCTPGLSISIALDYGQNGGDGSARYLINADGTDKLAYQLYRDAAYSQVWGTGSLTRDVADFPAASQSYTVYARLFAVSSLPPAGQYTDRVTVSLTY